MQCSTPDIHEEKLLWLAIMDRVCQHSDLQEYEISQQAPIQFGGVQPCHVHNKVKLLFIGFYFLHWSTILLHIGVLALQHYLPAIASVIGKPQCSWEP